MHACRSTLEDPTAGPATTFQYNLAFLAVPDGGPACAPGFADCNHDPSDGCETLLGSVANCSTCGACCPPPPPNANTTCVAAQCSFTCMTGFADCDAVAANGCETPLNTIANCGACGVACPQPANAVAQCVAGQCTFACLPGFLDCDANPVNGCEVNSSNNANHCGACNVSCPFGCLNGTCILAPNGTPCALGPQCASGNCVDGVCCDGACNTPCRRCNLPGSVGTCTNIPAGQDPDNECIGANCNGFGACNLSTGTPCFGGFQCETGFCIDGVCCNAPCGGTCLACINAFTGAPNGTCAPVLANTDPNNECGIFLDCDGAGNCS